MVERLNPETFRAIGAMQHEDFGEHLVVMAEAANVYLQREEQYQGLWKQAGALDSAQHCRHKALRMNITPGLETVDDALDLINYAVFYIRNVREGRVDELLLPGDEPRFQT